MLNAIIHHAESRCGLSGGPEYDELMKAKHLYSDLTEYCSNLQSVADKQSKLNRHDKKATSKPFPAMNEIVQGWLKSAE